ncbi:hypothetical protein IW492_09500 [Enterococcus sp. BWB1-3]|uniref:hypothetical protein n=1 Tax=unclassified Enterococcus TaxID=2608891 RepID=UPI0019213249|nr:MULTISPECIES: hypothetical protein [unclassified Enterococcus]MBL1229465.1 hypothetical protein [Enterococcus sp. BWB1-3]MCB5952639.1 hypothetical protein [Enterococcus sp. BWT-B8]
MNKNFYIFLAMVLLLLSGCSDSLSDEKVKFNGAGHTFEFQLPSDWDTQTESKLKENFGDAAAFGAEDTKSDSFMYILAFSKAEVDLENFAEKTREELQRTYGYENLEDVFMKEYEVNGYPAFKYTLNTSFENESMWAHFYYIATENSVVQVNYFSADDRNYEKRVEILNQSADSLVEKGAADSEGISDSSASDSSSNMFAENASMRFEVTGYRKVTIIDQEYLAVRFKLLNKGENSIKPAVWFKKTSLTIGNQVLNQSDFPEEEAVENLKVLAEANDDELSRGEESEGLAFYKVPTDKNNRVVSLTFVEGEFDQSQLIQMDLSVFD